jgi:Xaa-Pro aminopeptidase
MDNSNLTRLNDWLHTHGCDGALLSNPFTLTWLTGYAAPIESGPDPFLGAPALAWVHNNHVTVIASDAEAPALRAAGIDVQEYAGYTVDQPLACATRMTAALRAVLGNAASLSSPVAIEEHALSATLLRAAQAALPQARWIPSDDALAALRAVKSAAEIAKIRAALALCDLAQRHVRETLRAGITELDLWASLHAAVENAAGGRVPMLADLASGLRCADIGGPPTSRVLQPGDGVIFDFVPRLDGIWGDCCDTLYVGAPSAELKKLRQVSLDALRKGTAAVRPGVRACDLDALLRQHVRDAGYEPYPHHSGHGIGAAYHEAPRIVPYDTTVLEAGMVIALEPGVYVPGLGGARVEDVVLVTHDGCEVLTQHLIGR